MAQVSVPVSNMCSSWQVRLSLLPRGGDYPRSTDLQWGALGGAGTSVSSHVHFPYPSCPEWRQTWVTGPREKPAICWKKQQGPRSSGGRLPEPHQLNEVVCPRIVTYVRGSISSTRDLTLPASACAQPIAESMVERGKGREGS